MSVGSIQNVYHVRTGGPTDATQFDGVLNELWQEHGIAGIHFQDDRLEEFERAVLLNVCTRIRGRRI